MSRKVTANVNCFRLHYRLLFVVVSFVLRARMDASAGYLPAEKCGYGGEDGRQKILKEFPDADPNSIPDDAELQSKMMTILYEEYMDRLNRDF